MPWARYIRGMSAPAYIGFGSNEGEREVHLSRAKEGMGCIPQTQVLRLSPLYLTEPHAIDNTEQPWYLNAVFEVETAMTVCELFRHLKELEHQLGRVERGRWAPRCVDLDLLFYADQVVEVAGLTVPHREIQNRKFVLEPLHDLVPDFVHPVLRKTVKEMLGRCQDKHQTRKIK